MKNPNNGSSKLKRTRPEYRSHTGPPAQTEKPVCTASQLCEGCPAERAEEICAYCPLEGVALSAAHVAMQAKLEKLKAKSQNAKKVKSTLSKISKKVEADK